MPLDIGSRLGRNDVTVLIGEGGMGQVHRATDAKLNWQASLKSGREVKCGVRLGNVPAGIWTTALVLVALAMPISVWAEQLPLETVLTRAGEHVTAFRHHLSGIVAEELYEQRVRFAHINSRRERRTLRSDFLLVRPSGAARYVGFRDVFEVNGTPVRDREERLTRLFLDESAAASRHMERIRQESARYNIGAVTRDINTPTLALLVLRPTDTPRFVFERAADTEPRLGLAGPAPSPDVWVIAYRETSSPSVIRGQDGGDLPVQGRFWIETATGRVLVSELILTDAVMEATIAVRYDRDETVGDHVPVEMRERYDNRRQRSHIYGTATYTKFRRFHVQVGEQLELRR